MDLTNNHSESLAPFALEAVLFDVGGTLMEPWPSIGHVYAEVAEGSGWKILDVERLNHQF
ncbi:MAG TPA: HAD family hydrolase, partial [Verrucomicrobiales bacterium]|nr:HAD family hydrolase [Verrucomicrobiales bacterium]